MCRRGSACSSRRWRIHRSGDVDEVVGDDAKTHPSFHARGPLVATSIQPVSPLEQTDAALAAGAPLLRLAEPALLL